MGTGYTYRCGCGHPEPLMTGIGMLYPAECAETWDAVAAGKYGPKMKKAAEVHPDGGIDCENVIYLCDCGHWEADTRKSLWEHGDRSHMKSIYGKNRCIRKYYHRCPDCSRVMRVADLKNDRLICPKCGEPMTNLRPEILWD